MLGCIQNLDTDDTIACAQVQYHILGDTAVDEFLFPFVESKIEKIGLLVVINPHRLYLSHFP